MVVMTSGSVRACAGVTFRELVGGVALALHLLEDSPPKLFHCVALLYERSHLLALNGALFQ